MGASMLKIYRRANSINVRKVLWICHELDLEFEREDIGRGFTPTSTPGYIAINPMALIPAIDDDGVVIAESNTIVRYLAAKSGATQILPNNPASRANIEQWMDWQTSETSRPLRTLFIGGHLNMPPLNDPETQTMALSELSQHMQIADSQLARTGGHIADREFTVADIAVDVLVHRWFALDIKRTSLNCISNYYERLSERPCYRTNVRNQWP